MLTTLPIRSLIPAAFTALCSLCLITPARASIIYTNPEPDTRLDFPGTLILDLNNDGITDFSFRMFEGSFYHAGMTFYYPEIRITAAAGNTIVNGFQTYYPNYATLAAGDLIDSSRIYVAASDNVLATVGPNGPWPWLGSVDGGFLGLSLQSGPDTLYGWARITLQGNTHIILQDYAYQSQPGTSITAGAGSVPEPASLTLLTLAATTLLLRHRNRLP